jgi:nucleoside-diphosphate-sugar epimerase
MSPLDYALIGWSGYVGTTLRLQRRFDHQYRSTDIGSIRGRRFDSVVCAGAPAQKWIANREPEADAARIDGLIEHLGAFSCRRFVLISTVDVFTNPAGVDEDTAVDIAGLHAYGANRRRLELAVQERFENALVVRLPGLVGPGLRKNAIYDFAHDNEVHKIDSRGVFQFYPMVNLWSDIERALAVGLRLVHLTAEPISVRDIARETFGRDFVNEIVPQPPRYDFRSRHAERFGGQGVYTWSRRESLLAIRAYAQSESMSARCDGAGS